MKKIVAVIVIMVLFGIVLSAAAPIPPPNQTLQGTLRWQRSSICGVSDFVALPVMTNVYLTGNFEPTNGLRQGCQILATGFNYKVGACSYFAVERYQLSCTMSSSSGSGR